MTSPQVQGRRSDHTACLKLRLAQVHALSRGDVTGMLIGDASPRGAGRPGAAASGRDGGWEVNMKGKAAMVLLLGLSLLGAAPANAALSAAARRAVKCAEAKLRAVKRKVDAKLVCQAAAVRKGIAVPPLNAINSLALCFARAEAAFLTAFARAEAKGGCFNPNGNSESRAEGSIDSLIADTGSLLIPCVPSLSGTPCGPSDCSGRLTLCLPDVSGAPVCADTSACRQTTCTSDAVCEPGRACVAVLGVSRCCDICQ
jgi:hypothetical protein